MPKQILKNITSREWVIGGIAFLLLILILLFIFRKVPVPGNDTLYQHLQEQNDSLLKEQRNVPIRERQRQQTIDSLQNVIGSIDHKIDTIKKIYEKRITVYDTYSPEQLEKYFSDRYPGTGH